jgi:hypothetical protein
MCLEDNDKQISLNERRLILCIYTTLLRYLTFLRIMDQLENDDMLSTYTGETLIFGLFRHESNIASVFGLELCRKLKLHA